VCGRDSATEHDTQLPQKGQHLLASKAKFIGILASKATALMMKDQ
jgi:hypothetical protein